MERTENKSLDETLLRAAQDIDATARKGRIMIAVWSIKGELEGVHRFDFPDGDREEAIAQLRRAILGDEATAAQDQPLRFQELLSRAKREAGQSPGSPLRVVGAGQAAEVRKMPEMPAAPAQQIQPVAAAADPFAPFVKDPVE